MLPFIVPDHAVVVPKAADAAGDEIDREHHEAHREHEERHQPVQHARRLVKVRGRDQHAQHRERESEDRDARAQAGERRALFREQELHGVQNHRILLGGGFRSEGDCGGNGVRHEGRKLRKVSGANAQVETPSNPRDSWKSTKPPAAATGV